MSAGRRLAFPASAPRTNPHVLFGRGDVTADVVARRALDLGTGASKENAGDVLDVGEPRDTRHATDILAPQHRGLDRLQAGTMIDEGERIH